MSNELQDLSKYVNAAADLAESVDKDIKTDGLVSEKTKKMLAKFTKASYTVAETLEDFNETNQKLN